MEHPGRFLERAFLQPLSLTASELARAIDVPRSRISEVLAGKRGITADTAARLGRLFQVDPKVFLDRQAQWEIARLSLPEIEPLDLSDFLVGPEGAVPLPPSRGQRARTTTARFDPELLGRLRARAENTPSTGPRELVQVTYPSGQRAIVNKAR